MHITLQPDGCNGRVSDSCCQLSRTVDKLLRARYVIDIIILEGEVVTHSLHIGHVHMHNPGASSPLVSVDAVLNH
jgi:hypothetical protein